MALISRDEFLAELKKRKVTLKDYLSKLSEAKSNYEMINFKISLLIDDLLLSGNSFAGGREDLYSVIEDLLFTSRFPFVTPQLTSFGVDGYNQPVYVVGYQLSGGGYIKKIDSETFIKFLNQNKDRLISLWNPDYQAFVKNYFGYIYDYIDMIETEFNNMKAVGDRTDADILTNWLRNQYSFRNINAVSSMKLNWAGAMQTIFANFLDQVDSDFAKKLRTMLDSTVAVQGPIMFKLINLLDASSKAEALINSLNTDFEAFSDNLKAYLKKCESDPDLKDLVPAFDDLLKDEPTIVTGPGAIAVEGKSNKWLWIAGAAAAAYLASQ